ncbi:hypothetical protein V6N11_044403 [Hibiscus sabdariffa]|uniref:Uncharacterized protein n=1 Tax=Hibiscus sabdariffa TaxID=183260 RepID=A0ABR2RFI1_9ROSI
MVPQLSEEALTNPRVVSDSVVPFFGLALGRSPDASVPIHVPASLERVDHPDIEEEEQVMKKSKGEGDVVMDVSGVGFNGFTQGSIGTAGDAVMAVTGDGLGDSATEERCETDELSKSDTLEKFGPWMQVMGRRTRKGAVSKSVQKSDPQHRGVALKTQDSGKFSALANLERETEDVQVPLAGDAGLGVDLAALSVSSEGVVTNMGQSFTVGDYVPGDRTGVSRVELINGSGSVSKVSHDNENEVVARLEVASSERVAPVRVPKNHMVVRMLDDGRRKVQSVRRDHRNSAGDSNLRPKVVPRKSVHTSGDKKSMANRRKSNGRSSDKVTLGEWIGDLDNELLRNGKSLDSSTAVKQVEFSENPVSSMRWRDNTTFATDV